MTYDEIDLPHNVPLTDAAQAIEAVCEAEGLRVASRGPLAGHPGSILWRCKKGREVGTMEITLLNRERRILLSVSPKHVGPWSEAALESISETLINRVQRVPGKNLAGSKGTEAESDDGRIP